MQSIILNSRDPSAGLQKAFRAAKVHVHVAISTAIRGLSTSTSVANINRIFDLPVFFLFPLFLLHTYYPSPLEAGQARNTRFHLLKMVCFVNLDEAERAHALYNPDVGPVFSRSA